jgi:hypothetical protein
MIIYDRIPTEVFLDEKNIANFTFRVAWGSGFFVEVRNNRWKRLQGCVDLGRQMQVHFCADHATFLLRLRTTQQLGILSDFEGLRARAQSSRKRRGCKKVRLWQGGVCKKPTCRCIFAPMRLLFCSGCAAHNSWGACLVFRGLLCIFPFFSYFWRKNLFFRALVVRVIFEIEFLLVMPSIACCFLVWRIAVLLVSPYRIKNIFECGILHLSLSLPNEYKTEECHHFFCSCRDFFFLEKCAWG